MTILEWAFKYESMGFSVIPILSGPSKKPHLPWAEYQKRRATEIEIRGWFKKWPDMNIGVVTGEISNLLVVDTDTASAIVTVNDAIPESLPVPCQRTPSGGKHFFFLHKEGFSNRSNAGKNVGGVDIRTTGGYVVISPSITGAGHGWSWMEGLGIDEVTTPEIPSNITNIINTSLSFYLCTGSQQEKAIKSAEVSEVSGSQLFVKGQRDEGLFHLANVMVKGGLEPELTLKALMILANACDPPFPEKEVEEKVKSAINRAAKKERNITQELRDWVNESATGQFKVSEYQRESAVVSKQDKHTLIVALKKLCDQGVIERIGKRTGEYRIVDKSYVVQEWWNDEGKPLDIQFPLGVQALAKVYNGNIILLEGQKSQGKSAFALEFCRMNRKLFKPRIRYQNVEMSDSELIERFRSYPPDVISEQDWRDSVEFLKRTSDWWDLIEPDGLNVVDYLVEYEKAFLIADFVFKIHQRLKSGIALVVVQRDPFKPYPAGGRAVRDIPRLVLSLIHHEIRLEDTKSFWNTRQGNPSGLSRKYKQVAWWNFQEDGDWKRAEEEEEEKKYKAFRKKERQGD